MRRSTLVSSSLFATLGIIVVGCSGSSAYNPDRSAELLQQCDAKLVALNSEVQSLKSEVSALRDSAGNVGKFPWRDWTVDTGSKIFILSPTGIRFEFRFAKPARGWADWDEMGDAMVKLSRNEPAKRYRIFEFGAAEQTSEEAAKVQDLYSRLRQPLAALDSRAQSIESSAGAIQSLIQRAKDLLPQKAKR